MNEIKTDGLIMDFGRHAGKLYTRVPVGYLLWMVQSKHSKADIAAAELKRRGTTLPKSVDVSGHAIDKASLRCRRFWHETALNADEGLYSWLVRFCETALKQGTPDADGVLYYAGMKLVFEIGEWPVLKTIIPKKTFGMMRK